MAPIIAPTNIPVNHTAPMLQALDAAERALFGTPASPIITLCEARECGTYAAACLDVVGAEERGEWLVPVECRVCGGWFAAQEACDAN